MLAAILHKSVKEVEQLSAKELTTWQAYINIVVEGSENGTIKGA
jgi:hypothetical protein